MKTQRSGSDPWWLHMPWSEIAMAIGLSAWVPDLREGGTLLLRSVATAAAAGGLLWVALQPLSSRSLLLALARTGLDQVDIRAAMAQGRGIVVDASDADLGPGQAALINEVIATKIQLYTTQRSRGEPGFGVIADEVQEYQGAGQSFRRALALAAEYRVAWVLVNQYREGQLNAAMQAAVNLAGSHVFFRLAPGDVQPAVRILAQTVSPDILVQLEKRHYFSSERRQGKAVLLSGRTPDLPAPSSEVERRIRLNNAMGPTGSQVLAAAYRYLEETEGTSLWA